MAYYVYENWRARGHKAVIHKGDCPFCKNGNGLSGNGTRIDNGAWHGPFDQLNQAIDFANKTGGRISHHYCIY